MRAWLFLFLLFPLAAQAAETLPMQDFASIPILHEGRIKPLQSYARLTLKDVSGKDHIENKTASEWLAQTIFVPAEAAKHPVFLIKDKDLKERLKLAENDQHFSYIDLTPGIMETAQQAQDLLSKNAEDLPPAQQRFIDLHQKFIHYSQLLRSLTLILPLSLEMPEKFQHLAQDKPNLTYLDLAKFDTEIKTLTKEIVQNKGEDLSTYSDDEFLMAQTSFALDNLRGGAAPNTVLKIIPGQWADQQQEWFTPWEIILSGAGSPDTLGYLQLWKGMAHAYNTGDVETWDNAVRGAKQMVIDARGDISPARLRAEILYSQLQPYGWAALFYGISLILLLIPKIPFSSIALAISSLSALITHASGIAMRVYILERPPVGTLYESVLFVALVAALLGFVVFLKSKNRIALGCGALAALALLFVAPFSAPNAEKLDVLTAVLNTNFWLTTHVLIITGGYAICLLTGCLAHIYLGLRAFPSLCHSRESGDPDSRFRGNDAEWLFRLIYKTSLAALLFTAVGTILGGIWADQSWGRFWGWDPKENGALLIVLWIIWAQHGRLSGHLKNNSYAATMAALNIIIAVAWFGVNLLGVGLHSYGFTSGVALGLGLFCAAEAAIIAGLYWRAKTHA